MINLVAVVCFNFDPTRQEFYNQTKLQKLTNDILKTKTNFNYSVQNCSVILQRAE